MAAAHRAAKLKRTPKWLTAEQHAQIREWYYAAALASQGTGFPWHVDHVVPLRGRNVSGLNVPWNLQLLPGVDNQKKSNRFTA